MVDGRRRVKHTCECMIDLSQSKIVKTKAAYYAGRWHFTLGQASYGRFGMGKQNTAAAPLQHHERPLQDELAYLEDMIRELSAMADRLGCRTLTNILDVARVEAEIQSRRS